MLPEENFDQASRDFRMKFDLPTFNGHLHIEDFLDWLAEVEQFFEYMEIPDEKQGKLVAYRLKGGGSAWWEQLQCSCTHQGKMPIRSWPKMKRTLNVRFLLRDYEQTLFRQYQDCQQGTQTVESCKEILSAFFTQ